MEQMATKDCRHFHAAQKNAGEIVQRTADDPINHVRQFQTKGDVLTIS
jgi:hypothetical protein